MNESSEGKMLLGARCSQIVELKDAAGRTRRQTTRRNAF
jgi:hypothetical protein